MLGIHAKWEIKKWERVCRERTEYSEAKAMLFHMIYTKKH